MAAPRKKRDVEEMDQSDNDEFDDEDLDDSYSEDEDEDMLMSGEVLVDFEAMPPSDSDYDGIRALLNQLFLKENVNISQLAETIISQNYVGCIIKQCEVPEEEDSDEEVEDDPVFGVMSIINLSERKDLECVKQIKQMILNNCEKLAADKLQEFKQLFADNDSKQIGYLLHERFINIPPAIAVPMYDSLKKDMESEKVQKMKYKFDQFIFICKTCRPMQEGSKNTPIDINEIMFLNAEEEVLIEFAKCHFSYSVASQKDTVVDGEWEDELETLRTIIIIDSNKIDSAAAKMKSVIGKS